MKEKYDWLEQDPEAGKLFVSMLILAAGQIVDIDPDAPTDNWEEIVAGDAEC